MQIKWYHRADIMNRVLLILEKLKPPFYFTVTVLHAYVTHLGSWNYIKKMVNWKLFLRLNWILNKKNDFIWHLWKHKLQIYENWLSRNHTLLLWFTTNVHFELLFWPGGTENIHSEGNSYFSSMYFLLCAWSIL